jgi:6-pyruvoyltetrahydropterin/6-carboxytetrahydropterin synthase
MAKIRLTKIFSFETAHALYNYDGLCRNIHGHSYKLAITIIGEPNQDTESSKYGMVMDFGILKKIVNSNIIDIYDHSLVLNKAEELNFLNEKTKLFTRIHIVDFQPTAENLILHFVEIIKNELPQNITLFSIKLHETENSFAEWYQDDNT